MRPIRPPPIPLRLTALLLTCLLHVGLLWLVCIVRPLPTGPVVPLQVQSVSLVPAAPPVPVPDLAPVRAALVPPSKPPPLLPIPALLPSVTPTQPVANRVDGTERGDAPAAQPLTGPDGDMSPGPQAEPAAVGPPPDYVGRILARLERAKRYPVAAKTARQEGTVLLRFVLDRRGRLLDWRIEGSSGVAALDEEVAALVRRVAPFPPFPDDMARDRLELTVPIDFSLSTGH
ncbi:energy transducer TonB [Niveispirillum sp. BGYR6]|uniref:energy transducer TonB n=1 Tax=Niveispirillum sp. BGYR6 TaxID=2971249 RepID=UPI0022B98B69|nr:energy transducer TonB [Niveispirillum sp. BGYR6]MDG5493918.1 energy transducer TonB [Niveispirillum sp. BGYR6]